MSSIEFNVGVDPEAANYVFASGVHVAMVGLEMGGLSLINHAWRHQEHPNSGATASIVKLLTPNYRVHWEEDFSMARPNGSGLPAGPSDV